MIQEVLWYAGCEVNSYKNIKGNEPDIKKSAEAILEKLGIPVSVFIDMTYRQVINHGGIPFDVEFNTMMEKGLKQAKADESMSVTDAFVSLRKGI